MIFRDSLYTIFVAEIIKCVYNLCSDTMQSNRSTETDPLYLATTRAHIAGTASMIHIFFWALQTGKKEEINE